MHKSQTFSISKVKGSCVSLYSGQKIGWWLILEKAQPHSLVLKIMKNRQKQFSLWTINPICMQGYIWRAEIRWLSAQTEVESKSFIVTI